jgi:transcriptional regulator with XRE-family HTH domain
MTQWQLPLREHLCIGDFYVTTAREQLMSRGTVEIDITQAKKLGEEIARRRISMGYRSARSLSRETGLDYRTITRIESGQPMSVDRNTLVALEIGLNWPVGSIDKILQNANAESDMLLSLSYDVTSDIVKDAMKVAQAAFDAYVNTRIN